MFFIVYMNILMLLYIALLFFVLTPGILLTLPPNGDKYTVAAVHSIVFVIVLALVYNLLWTKSQQ